MTDFKFTRPNAACFNAISADGTVRFGCGFDGWVNMWVYRNGNCADTPSEELTEEPDYMHFCDLGETARQFIALVRHAGESGLGDWPTPADFVGSLLMELTPEERAALKATL